MTSHRVVAWIALAALAAGCASAIHNDPINVPLSPSAARTIGAATPGSDKPPITDDVLIALAFSGGGTRAAAFSFGVLTEMDKARVVINGRRASLIDHLDIVSGVSGGSVTAAYLGLRKRAALDDFREKFLLRNAEEAIETDINLITISSALAGGVNDSTRLPRWLDRHLFNGATFGTLRKAQRPLVFINASDIYNRTPFVFSRPAFAAICSDLDSYPIATAVAASAAVPLIFAPVVLKSYPDRCAAKLPAWIARARSPNAPLMLKAFADAIGRYREGQVPYIKLLDGGLVDNFGISGFTIARLSADTPYGPLSPQEAVLLRRVLFLVVDAGRGPSGNWVNTVAGPSGADLVVATADTAIDAGTRAGLTAFETVLNNWQQALVQWRCGLSAAERRRLGAPAGWNCRNIKLHIDRIGFDQFDPAREAALNAVQTRFRLPQQQVDMVIAAGANALARNRTYRAFLASVGGRQ